MEQEEKKYSILDELSKCSGYDMALMTTFNFEFGFFERAVLNRLYAKDVRTVSLFVDAAELTNSLNEFNIVHSGSHIGKKYMVTPVKMNGSFHPKVILLLGEKKARLFVGSANLKTSGYAVNNEVFNFIDYDTNHPEYLDVIVAAIDFFDAINEISYKLDNAVIKAAKEYIYYHKADRNGNVFLLHNMKKPILNQVEEMISDDIESINIAVPYFDKELLALQQIKTKYSEANIRLYIQNGNSTFPVDYNEKNQIVDDIRVFCGFLDNTSSTSGNFYHGKVFLFKTKNQAFIIYGSANCTLSAITKTPSSGGNIECDFLEVGDVSDFDYFFDNMELDVEGELTAQEMVYESTTSEAFSFKYGESKERIELHLGYSIVVEPLLIKLGEKELEYERINGEILVFIGEDCKSALADIFEISLIYDNKKEVLRCWIYNPIILASNREIQNRRDSLSDFEIDSFGDKFMEDRIKFFKAEATTLNEWQEYKNNLKYMNQIKMEQETESEETDDFIVDYKIPDEYRYAYRQYNAVSKIRGIYVRRFMASPCFLENKEGEKSGKKTCQQDNEKTTIIHRKATSEEKRFENFIKGKVKGMMNDIYVEVVELEHYIGLVQVVFEIFDKYSRDEDVEDIFTPEYVIETESRFMTKIIEKSIDNISNRDQIQDAIIKKSIYTIIETFLFYRELRDSDERWKFESLNKNLLSILEKKYNLRQLYRSIVKQIITEDKSRFTSLSLEGACNYIEQLYGYKTYDMLCEEIRKVYADAEINKKGTLLQIVYKSNGVIGFGKPDIGVLREVAKYSRNVSRIDTVRIEIINQIVDSDNKYGIVKKSHSIDMQYHQWSHIDTRYNGERCYVKSEYLIF